MPPPYDFAPQSVPSQQLLDQMQQAHDNTVLRLGEAEQARDVTRDIADEAANRLSPFLAIQPDENSGNAQFDILVGQARLGVKSMLAPRLINPGTLMLTRLENGGRQLVDLSLLNGTLAYRWIDGNAGNLDGEVTLSPLAAAPHQVEIRAFMKWSAMGGGVYNGGGGGVRLSSGILLPDHPDPIALAAALGISETALYHSLLRHETWEKVVTSFDEGSAQWRTANARWDSNGEPTTVTRVFTNFFLSSVTAFSPALDGTLGVAYVRDNLGRITSTVPTFTPSPTNPSS